MIGMQIVYSLMIVMYILNSLVIIKYCSYYNVNFMLYVNDSKHCDVNELICQ